jgi:hypothetical protein
MIKLASFQRCKDGSTHANKKCNTAYKQNHMIISIGTEKTFDKFNISSNQSLEETRNRRNVPQHNKGYI